MKILLVEDYKKDGVLKSETDFEITDGELVGVSREKERDVMEIIIPSGVTVLGDNSCDLLPNLEKVTVPESVRVIGQGAFEHSRLAHIEFLGSSRLKVIERRAFYETGLKEITLPDNLTSIGSGAFAGTYLKDIVIPQKTSLIEHGAFHDCEKLESVKILGNAIDAINDYTFADCFNLKNVIFSDSVEYIESYAFRNCFGLQNIKLPKYLDYIEDHAFNGCGLTDIEIPESVTAIGSFAFGNCKNLTRATILGIDTSIDDGAFSSKCTICCKHESEAEEFAKANGNKIEYLD